MVNHSLPTQLPAVNPDREPANDREMRGLRDSFQVVRELAYASLITEDFNPPYAFWKAMGMLESHINSLTGHLGGVSYSYQPLSIYEPTPEPEPFEPSPQDRQWAAENLSPGNPTTPEQLMGFLGDQMMSIRLAPAIHKTTIDFEFQGREWSLELIDRTARDEYYEMVARDYEPRHGLTEGESQALAAGLPL